LPRFLAIAFLLIYFSRAAPADRLEFEVASVRVAVPLSRQDPEKNTGGPGTSDPQRISYRGYPIAKWIQDAYGVPSYRLSIPDSFKTKRYDIVAKVPAGTTQEQFDTMLQNLLADRVGLRIHRQPTPFETYKLAVVGRGPKLQETRFKLDDPSESRPPKDADGFNMIPHAFEGGMRAGVFIVTGARKRCAALPGFWRPTCEVPSPMPRD
jgi:uncharacterized protein (TIGR03435 family)